MHVLSLFVSLGKSRQWDPWLQRPSCHSKSQSHLWHWAPWPYYLWTLVHHLPGWERGETRECGRGKHTGRMPLPLHAPYAGRSIPHLILCFCWVFFLLKNKRRKEHCVSFIKLRWKLLRSAELLCPSQLQTARRERSPLPDDKVRYYNCPCADDDDDKWAWNAKGGRTKVWATSKKEGMCGL